MMDRRLVADWVDDAGSAHLERSKHDAQTISLAVQAEEFKAILPKDEVRNLLVFPIFTKFFFFIFFCHKPKLLTQIIKDMIRFESTIDFSFKGGLLLQLFASLFLTEILYINY